MGKASEIWKEIKPKIGEMLMAVNNIETQAEKAQEEAYQRGLSDAWEAARKIGSNSMCSLKEMGFDFSRCVVADYNPSWFVVKNYSASEAVEKIRQYEQEKEMDGLRQNIQTIVDQCGYSLDEIATVLKKMRGEQDG